jgi:uncharacterized protein YuzE
MVLQDYDKEYDIMYVHWGDKTEHSAELLDGRIILDFDKDDNIVGFEFMDFLKAIKEHDIKLDKLFSKEEKSREVKGGK